MSLEVSLLSLVSFATVLVILAFIFLIFIYLSSHPYPNLERLPKERVFYDASKLSFVQFSFGLNEKPTVDLSIVIPAYNESLRCKTCFFTRLVPIMMDEAIKYLEFRKKNEKFTYEIIVVDDGSTDNTTQVALNYSEKFSSDVIRVLTLQKNRGKGAAVRIGMLSSRGKLLLFADADGATKFSEIEKLEDKLLKLSASIWNGSNAVICGSRSHLNHENLSKRNPIRTLLMHLFHFAVWFLCVKGINDTQCGFKLFTRSTARLLFYNQHVERWAFDVDILYLANYFEISIAEVPVEWHEVDGSKIIPIFSWLQMAKDLLFIRLRYALGAWKIEPSHHFD